MSGSSLARGFEGDYGWRVMPRLRIVPPRAVAAAAWTLAVSVSTIGCDRSEAASVTTERLTFERLQLRVPRSWSVHRLLLRCGGISPGILVANIADHSFEREARPPGACTTEWELERAPRDFVLIDVSRFTFPRPPLPGAVPPMDSRFPLTFATSIKENVACRCTFLSADLWFDGLDYSVRTWIGGKASTSDQLALDALLRSIRPKRR